MSEKRLLLTCPGRYTLDLNLPYEVLSDKGTAKFDKSKKALTVTIPVVAMAAVSDGERVGNTRRWGQTNNSLVRPTSLCLSYR